jgi:integrase
MTPPRPSIPVGSTTDSLKASASDAPAPVGLPVGQWERVAAALATAGDALAAVALALRGETGPPPSLNTPAPPAPRCIDGITVKEAINEFLISKARAGRSDRYLRQLRVSLSNFARGRAMAPLASVSLSEVERWIFGQGWEAKTMKGYLSDVRTLFRFAERRGHVASAAACRVELPECAAGGAPGIHSPADVRRVLECARRTDLDVMRHLAVRYFTGVRSAEAHRLTEADILTDRGFIEVPAVKAKTRRRRLVRILPALSAWLAMGGALRPMSDKTVRRVARLSGAPWPANVTRHSFVSYHLAAFENAGKTALEAGHSEAMLFAHYRAVVTQAAALEYWAILPA